MAYSKRIGSGSLLACAALACLLPASALQGATVTDSDTFSFPLSPNSTSVTLDLFNPALGTLQEVELAISGSVQADITGENDSAIAGNMSVNLTALLGVTASGLSASAGIVQSAGPVAVSATDGVPGSGSDFNNFGTISGSGSADDSTFSVASFIGPGTFNAAVNGNGGFNISGVTDSTLQISNFVGSGTVTVTYFYTPNAIPEPSAFAICGLVLGGAGVLRRRRAA